MDSQSLASFSPHCLLSFGGGYPATNAAAGIGSIGGLYLLVAAEGQIITARRSFFSRVEALTEKGAKEMKPAQVSTPSETEVLVRRSFDAPAYLVWRTYTEPSLVRRWLLGPPGWSMPLCEMDVRVGGKYRWRWRSDEDGKEFGFSGEFQEVAPHSKLVHTEYYDAGDLGDSMGKEGAVVTVTLHEGDGVTNVTTSIRFASKEDRDAALSTGMTDGMEMSYKQLDGVLAK
jgi:uncharacterized protein YndB with AHSA1/START domain